MNRKKFTLLVMVLLCIAGAGCTAPEESIESPPTPVPPVTGATPQPADTETSSPPTETTPPSPSPLPKEWRADGIISEGEYLNSLTVGDGIMEIFWSSESDILYMALRSRHEGWVAIGFRPTSGMDNADIILGGSEDGETYIYDMYSTGPYGPHPADTDLGGTFDILAFEAIESNSRTTIEFSRLMNTGDKFDSELTEGETIPIIWAVSANDEPLLKHNIGKGRVDFTT